MYRFETSDGKKVGGPVATRAGALSMALHMANKRDEPITVVGGNEPVVVCPSREDR